MIAFRAAHPSIGRSTYWRDDVTWFGVDGYPDLADYSRSVAYLLDGASENDDDLYVMINAWDQALDFTIQDGSPEEWSRRRVDPVPRVSRGPALGCCARTSQSS